MPHFVSFYDLLSPVLPFQTKRQLTVENACSCFLLDAGTFTSYLTTVKSWLDSNPNEVITLLLVNSDGISPSVWAQSYTDSGLSKYVYTPSSVPVAYDSWPTLQEMISANTRVVSFLAQQADVSSVPYLLDEFTNVWETPYDVSRSFLELESGSGILNKHILSF